MNARHLALLGALALPVPLAAQDPRAEVFAGSEFERYLRYLQLTDSAVSYPWSIGGFSQGEIDQIWPTHREHPWAERYDRARSSRTAWFAPIAPVLSTVGNTGFAHGSNDGPVWAGRGFTAAVQVGFAARYGPFSLTVAPLAFVAQNADFPIVSNGLTGDSAFADPQTPYSIDRPQRFGDGSYSVVDPGQTTLRVDAPFLAAGISTANQRWGPGEQFPILLGPNAAGFPHLFVGTSAPVDLWLFSVHTRILWGLLSQSAYSTSPDSTRRFMSGLGGIITPRGVPGLELGGARFFHTPWPANGLTARDFGKPLEGFLKVGARNDIPGETSEDVENQIASAFFRWVFPRGGFEFYGEYAREDHSWDLRDFLLEPDHASGYLLGLRKVFRGEPTRFLAVRAETVDLERSTLLHGRSQGPFYIHGYVRQGHTQRGQVLGADVGGDGSGSFLAVDSYHPGGRVTVSWSRVLRRIRGDYWRSGVLDPKGRDMAHALAGEVLAFRGRFEVLAHAEGVYEFNRNWAGDAFNLNVALRVRVMFRSDPGHLATVSRKP